MNIQNDKNNTDGRLGPAQILGKILEKENVKPFQFAKMIGANHQTIGDILSGKTAKISLRLREKICAKFTNVNPDWLRTGEGEMVKTMPNSVQIAQEPHDFAQGENACMCEHCKMVENLQKQIDRLLTVIEHMQK